MSLTVHVPRVWRTVDRVLAQVFRRPQTTAPPATWLIELMERRMGAVIVCQPCIWKYGDWIRRLGYTRHPDINIQGGRCDGCKTTYDLLPVLIAEEKRGRAEVTRAQLDHEHARRLAPVPELFRA